MNKFCVGQVDGVGEVWELYIGAAAWKFKFV